MVLFASRQNRKVPKFVAWSRDPVADAVDTLVALWSQFRLLYAFPLLKLLSRLLRRVELEGVILVAPDWPRRSWYADVVRLKVAGPWILPLREDYLSQGLIFHPTLVTGFKGLAVESKVLRQGSVRFCDSLPYLRLGNPLLGRFIIVRGKRTLLGVNR